MLNQPGSLYAHQKLAALREDDLARRALRQELLHSVREQATPDKPSGRAWTALLRPIPRLSFR